MYMKITIEQYQKYKKIDSGQTDMEISAQIFDILKLNPDDYKDRNVTKELESFLKSLIVSKKQHKYVRLNKIWFKVDRELYDLAFGQWITFDNIMKYTVKEKINEDLHLIIASFIRPCRFWKLFPRKFDSKKVKDISELVKNMDMSIGIELSNFFFLYTVHYMRSTNIEYLEKLDSLETRLIYG